MTEYFEIFGTPIKMSTIKDFRIVQREYIYRPTYREVVSSAKSGFFGQTTYGSRYEFYAMQPYAAIFDEHDRRTAISEFKPIGFGDALGKDIADAAIVAIGDKFNLKAIKAKKYKCVNQTGRIFSTYLEDIPALIMRSDGKMSDVRKDDELYHQLGEPIAPAINIVNALLIKTTTENFVFYGSGVQIEDIGVEYSRLKNELEAYRLERKEEKERSSIGYKIKQAIPQKPPTIQLPVIIKEKNPETIEEKPED